MFKVRSEPFGAREGPSILDAAASGDKLKFRSAEYAHIRWNVELSKRQFVGRGGSASMRVTKLAGRVFARMQL